MSDARNITLNGSSAEAVAVVQERFVLPHMMDATRLGIAFALARGLDPVPADGPTAHNFNVATIDDEGLLVKVVRMMRPHDARALVEPYRVIEELMNVGVRAMAEAVKSGELNDIADLLTLGGPRDASE